MCSTKQNSKDLAYALLRLAMGVNMFVHGMVRLPKLEGFNTWMVGYFQDTFLPDFLVSLLAYTIPFVELIVGALLILGLFTRQALLVGALLIVVLLFGACLKENWEWASFQMIYAIFFFMLSYFIELNKVSIDKLRGKCDCEENN
ncbi:DoxX family protein [Arcobacter sp. CECT 8989]|uniref:DoxX family protein n=1 Tax=Arcobacter sp. CECT 8989 TaxID=2044509 RepID=UPI00100A4D52|nr:DoxX family protein [Arcobacter sp. CECT 8989]RXJ98450.1 DoxX family protein [Arcobacter sp. CECT 8989]